MQNKECTDPLAIHSAICLIKKVSNILNCLKCVFNLAELYINDPNIKEKLGPFSVSNEQLGDDFLNKYKKFNDYFKCISGIVADKNIFKFKLSEALLWLISGLLGSPGYISIKKDCYGKPQYVTKFISKNEFDTQGNIMVVNIESSEDFIEHIAKGGENAFKVRDYYNSQQYFLLDSKKVMTKFKLMLSCVEQQSEEKKPENQKRRYKKVRREKIKKSEKKEKTRKSGKKNEVF